MKSYIAINLNQFHSNQKDAGTTTDLKFILAKNIEEAKKTVKNLYPNEAWAVITKNSIDQNIVYKSI